MEEDQEDLASTGMQHPADPFHTSIVQAVTGTSQLQKNNNKQASPDCPRGATVHERPDPDVYCTVVGKHASGPAGS